MSQTDYRLRQTYPVVETPDGVKVNKYGKNWDYMPDLAVELTCWRWNWTEELGGLGGYNHLKRAYEIAYPELMNSWHEWTEERYKTLSSRDPDCKDGITPKHERIVLSGCASSAKSRDAGYYSWIWWAASPHNRSVIVMSTSMESLRIRVWNYVEEARLKWPNTFGHVKNHPNPKILFQKSDNKHGIHGFAIKPGSPKRAIQDVIGIHPDGGGILIVVDEAPDMPIHLNDAIPNWKSGQQEFQILYLGNGDSRYNLHGLMMEPHESLGGWGGINPDIHTKWKTNQHKGICIYSDAYKSPRLKDPENQYLSFLPSWKDIKEQMEALGENHPSFWRMIRGFPPPDDDTNTVLTPSLCDFHQIQAKAHWSGRQKFKIAGLDPAFVSGGDGCILRVADFGESLDGGKILDYGSGENVFDVPLDISLTEPTGYQIMDFLKKVCKDYQIPPEYVAVDVSGTGLGLSQILDKEWSNRYLHFDSGGSASDNPVDASGKRLAKELYDRAITEMWLVFREYVLCDQIRGLDRTSIEEFCFRMLKEKSGTKKKGIETKKEYKIRRGTSGGKSGSPDFADAACMCLAVARRIGFPLQRLGEEAKREISEADKVFSAFLRFSANQTQESRETWSKGFTSMYDDDFEGELIS